MYNFLQHMLHESCDSLNLHRTGEYYTVADWSFDKKKINNTGLSIRWQ